MLSLTYHWAIVSKKPGQLNTYKHIAILYYVHHLQCVLFHCFGDLPSRKEAWPGLFLHNTIHDYNTRFFLFCSWYNSPRNRLWANIYLLQYVLSQKGYLVQSVCKLLPYYFHWLKTILYFFLSRPRAMPKEVIEVVDFEALDWKLRGCKLSQPLRMLLHQL